MYFSSAFPQIYSKGSDFPLKSIDPFAGLRHFQKLGDPSKPDWISGPVDSVDWYRSAVSRIGSLSGPLILSMSLNDQDTIIFPDSLYSTPEIWFYFCLKITLDLDVSGGIRKHQRNIMIYEQKGGIFQTITLHSLSSSILHGDF